MFLTARYPCCDLFVFLFVVFSFIILSFSDIYVYYLFFAIQSQLPCKLRCHDNFVTFLQVFEPSTQTFHCRDKYFGRTLDREALRSVLRRFFSNGSGDVICRVIDRLQAIKSSLKQLRSYRFYSSSLLVIYDGAVTSSKPHNATAVDIRMVDFAKSTNSNLDGQMVHEGPDLGYIFGLTNLIQLLSEIVPSDSP